MTRPIWELMDQLTMFSACPQRRLKRRIVCAAGSSTYQAVRGWHDPDHCHWRRRPLSVLHRCDRSRKPAPDCRHYSADGGWRGRRDGLSGNCQRPGSWSFERILHARLYRHRANQKRHLCGSRNSMCFAIWDMNLFRSFHPTPMCHRIHLWAVDPSSCITLS